MLKGPTMAGEVAAADSLALASRLRRRSPVNLRNAGRTLVVAAMVMCGTVQMAALKTAAGFTVGDKKGFDAFGDFINNLALEARPLAIPVALISIIIGGLKIMIPGGGNDGGQWIAAGFIGGGVVLLGPTLVA